MFEHLFTEEKTQQDRNVDSIKDQLINEIANDKRFSGRGDFVAHIRKLVLAEHTDSEFSLALNTVAEKILSLFPPN